MRHSRLFILALIVIGSLVTAQNNRVLEKAGGFSYLLPKGWVAKAIPGYKYQFAFAPPSQSFAPNINFVDEAFGGSLQDYVAGNKTAMTKAFKKYRLLSEARAATANVGDAVKLTIQDEQNGKLLSQTFYFVDAGSKKFVITCTTLPNQRASLEPQCDELVKSFKLE